MQTPAVVHDAVPWAPLAWPVTVSGPASTSLSLPSTLTAPAVSSAVVRLSATAFGASLTGVTVTVTVTVLEDRLPSEAR